MNFPDATAIADFERCSGVNAAVQYVERLNAALFVVSTLISPGGLAFLGITMIIEKLLDRSCAETIAGLSDKKKKKLFWTFDDFVADQLNDGFEVAEPSFWAKSKRALTKKNAVEFVQDFLLAPVYNGESFCTLAAALVWLSEWGKERVNVP